MRHSLVVCCLIFGAGLTSLVCAQPSLEDEMNTSFEVWDKKPNGQCSKDNARELAVHLSHMRSMAKLATLQVPSNRPSDNPNTAALEQNQLNTEASPPAYKSLATTLQAGYQLSIKVRKRVTGDRSLIFCDSTVVKLMTYDQDVPFTDPGKKKGKKRKLWQLFPSANKKGKLLKPEDYYYLWIKDIGGLSRIRKTDLITIPPGKPHAGLPFPPYGDERRGFGPSYCAGTGNPVWSFVVTKWAADPDRARSINRAVFIMCPQYFQAETGQAATTLLRDVIDLKPQNEKTSLESMKPAWLSWYMALLFAARASMARTTSGSMAWADRREYKGPRRKMNGVPELPQQKAYTFYPDQKALSVSDCITLVQWQRAAESPPPLSSQNWPSLFNPPCVAWFALAVWLQQKGQDPRNWEDGSAGHYLAKSYPEDEAGGNDGSDRSKGHSHGKKGDAGDADDDGDAGDAGDDGDDGGEGSSRGAAGERPGHDPADTLLGAMEDCDESSDDGGGGRIEL